jgi:hypothetical protein
MNSILDPEHHKRLLLDLPGICQVANVLPMYVHHSMKDYCTPAEIDWVVNFRDYQAQGTGLVLTGTASPEERMMAIAGAFLRNFVDARVMSLTTVLDLKDMKALPDPTVMLIPNLFLRSVGKALPAWKVQIVYDILLHRLTSNKPTVVYVEDMVALAAEYGRVFADHLTKHYITVA